MPALCVTCRAGQVGGAGKARYQKQGAVWRDALLTSGIARLAAALGPKAAAAASLRCLNMVVPTYR